MQIEQNQSRPGRPIRIAEFSTAVEVIQGILTVEHMYKPVGHMEIFEVTLHNLGMGRVILHKQNCDWFAIHRVFLYQLSLTAPGKVNLKHAPWSLPCDSTRMAPPFSSTIRLMSARPRPDRKSTR